MFDFKNIQSKKLSLVFGIISKLNIRLLITLICLGFIGKSVYDNFEALADQNIGIEELAWLSGGILFSLFSIIINAYAWKLLINSIGCNSNNLKIIKIFINTNIYKYLPGGIWHFASRYNILRKNFSKQKSAESIVLEPLLMMVAALIVIPFGGFNIFLFILCWSSTLLFLPGLREIIIKKMKTMKASIFNSDKGNDRTLIENKQNIATKIFYPYKPLFVEVIFILVRFLGFFCCMNAFSIGSLFSQLELISYFSLAWLIGLLVPAAPGGIGVFESIILFCLSAQLSEAPLLASLLCYRLVSTVSDILAALLYPIKKLFKA
ncbi:lysylphosphatidylglycerol synthase domain-containing protein [Prochlorococcus marinus]|uniref:Uncharacterized protein n=2 Tax=Prochlorococcus marinus TaxID=1219 RepID=A0A318RFH8_PROMR|nr:lysylphosphatidylglycerol synthase domain-containing protein [Prochlorococcus marinus]MBW3041515.1 hypothetical protein [Prochlorococcus marinus str. XMU1408]PYE02673.1 hypothetical protein DNJ73_02675 [Prochlorococcus marinus XMU1408]